MTAWLRVATLLGALLKAANTLNQPTRAFRSSPAFFAANHPKLSQVLVERRPLLSRVSSSPGDWVLSYTGRRNVTNMSGDARSIVRIFPHDVKQDTSP
jgi:hypothetical protein